MIEAGCDFSHHACVLLTYASFMSFLFTEGSFPVHRTKFSGNMTTNHTHPSSSTSLPSSSFASKLVQWHVHYCGYNRVCQNFSPSICYRCAPCMCDKICHRYDDCCPDVAVSTFSKYLHNPFSGKHNAVPEECHNVDIPQWRLTHRNKKYEHLPDIKTKIKSTYSSANRFFMVSHCPSNSLADAKNCEEVEGESPVTSVGNGSTVFKNVFCARCHGVIDVIPWDVYIICPLSNNTSMHSLRNTALHSFLQNDCNAVFSPPDFTSHRQCYSQSSMISKCNETGNWRNNNAFLARACESYRTPTVARGKIYQNIFCYLCNQKDDSFDPDLGKCGLDPAHRETSFEAKLNYLQMDAAESEISFFHDSGYEVCGESGVFDSKERKCRELICPFGQRLKSSSDSCQPAFISVKGVTYELYFKLKPQVPIHLSEQYDYIHHLPAEMEIVLRQQLRKSKVIIEDFAMAFNTTTDRGRCRQSTNDLAIYARVKCPALTNQTRLQDKLLSLRRHTFNVANGRWNITMQSIPSEIPWHLMAPSRRHSPHSLSHCITIVAKDIDKRRDDGTKRVGTTTPDPTKVHARLVSPPDVRISNLLTCPHVRLLPKEFTYFGVGHDLLLAWKSQPLSGNDYTVDVDGSISICFSQFLDKLSENNQRTLTEILCAMILLPLCIACLVVCLVVYFSFPALRTIPGKNNMVLILCLALTETSIWAGYFVPYYSTWCTAMGMMCHYFSLCLFLSLGICSCHLYTVFSTMHLSVDITKENRTFILHCCCVFIIPLIVISLVVIISKSSDHQLGSTGYGSGALCFLTSSTAMWLALFLPLVVFAAVSLVLFLLTYLALQTNADVETNITDERHVHFYFRASLIVIFVWTIGTIAMETAVPVMRILFIVSQFCLGLYIFITLVINRRIAGLVSASWCAKRAKNATTLPLRVVKSNDTPANSPAVITTGYRQTDSPKSFGKSLHGSQDMYLEHDRKSQLSSDGYGTIETMA